jgi:hypothetical protein
MTSPGGSADQVARARAQVLAISTLANTVATSVLTVSGYQAYVRSSFKLWPTLVIMAIIVLLLIASFIVSMWYPIGRPTKEDLQSEKYVTRANNTDLKNEYKEALEDYNSATRRRLELEEKKGLSAEDQKWLQQDFVGTTEARLRELAELVRAVRQVGPRTLALVIILCCQIGFAVTLFLTLPKAPPVGAG